MKNNIQTNDNSNHLKSSHPYNMEETIKEITDLSFPENNLISIPLPWYQHICFKNGKTDDKAIRLLADIVYWYRAILNKNSITGEIISYEKKFNSEMLQCSISEFSKRLKMTKNEVNAAIERLEEAGLIVRHLKTIKIGEKVTLINVQHVAPVVDAIRSITVKKEKIKALNELKRQHEAFWNEYKNWTHFIALANKNNYSQSHELLIAQQKKSLEGIKEAQIQWKKIDPSVKLPEIPNQPISFNDKNLEHFSFIENSIEFNNEKQKSSF